jgi:hypothetical protein
MNVLKVWLGTGLVLSVALTGAGFLAFGVIPSQGQGDARDSEASLLQERRRTEHLQAKLNQLRRRQQAIRGVIAEVIAGRTTLFQAAAQVQALERDVTHPRHYRHLLRSSFGGNSLEENLCRKVIVYVREQVKQRPGLAATVRRLEAELGKELRRHGKIRLPRVAATEAPSDTNPRSKG